MSQFITVIAKLNPQTAEDSTLMKNVSQHQL